MRKRVMAMAVLTISGGVAPARATAQEVLRPDVAAAARGEGWQLWNRAAFAWTGTEGEGVRLDARAGHGIAWLDGVDFEDGSIEVLVRGENAPGRSFVGLAFRGVDGETFDAVYLRPFNFRADAELPRSHSVQYVSHPDHTWPVLRERHPGVYEAAIASPPLPDDFVWLRVELLHDSVSVFVDGAGEPSLTVPELSGRSGGRVGLWVGNGSQGTFARLVLRPAPGSV